MTAFPAPVRDPGEVKRTIAEFSREPHGALIVLPAHRRLIIAQALERRLPAIYPNRFTQRTAV
jgi:hypothetical protein